MIRARRFVNRAKHAPKISDGFTALDIGNLLKKEITEIASRLRLSAKQRGYL